MTDARQALKELYDAIHDMPIHPHLLECNYCPASIHRSRIGKALSEARCVLREPDIIADVIRNTFK